MTQVRKRAHVKNMKNYSQSFNQLLVGSAHSNIHHFLKCKRCLFTFFGGIVIHSVRQKKIDTAVSDLTPVMM